jgi:Spy/CpxP family protein refolding chaperone
MKRLLGLVFITVTCILAQGPVFFPWWDSPIAGNLKLSEDQKTRIRETVREYRDQLIQQRADVQIAEANLQDLMDEDQVNESAAADAIDKLVTARANLTRTFSKMSLKLRLVLTPEQWRELERRRPRGRVGPGVSRRGRARRPVSPETPPKPPEPPPPGLDGRP